jgi:hypothetical protein
LYRHTQSCVIVESFENASFRHLQNCVIFEIFKLRHFDRSIADFGDAEWRNPCIWIYPAPTGPLATVRGCKQNTGVSPLAPLGRDDASKEGARYYEMTIQKRMRTLAGAQF